MRPPALSSSRRSVSSEVTFADRARLLLLSFLLLFAELALIRWTAANNVHLASLTNIVLLASFLGIGIGFLRVDSRFSLLSALRSRSCWLCWSRSCSRSRCRSACLAPAAWCTAKARGLPLIQEWLSVSVVFLFWSPRRSRESGRGRSQLQALRPARGVPDRHPRQPAWDHRVFGAVVPVAAADRVGRDRVPGARRVDLAQLALVAGHLARRGARRARDRVGVATGPLVALLQDPRGSHDRAAAHPWDPDARRDHRLGEQHPLADGVPDFHATPHSSRSTSIRTGTWIGRGCTTC